MSDYAASDAPTRPEPLALSALLSEGRRIRSAGGWPRSLVDPTTWRRAIGQLAAGHWSLLGLWGEAATVHMALLAPGDRSDGGGTDQSAVGLLSLDCPQGRFPSVGQRHPAAQRLERAIRDLWGLEPDGLWDRRPWLDHGRWVRTPPLATAPADSGPPPEPYAFLPAEGESLHVIPVGPVHAGIIEPGHFRFTANGETIVRLEERLGYVHKGIEGLMAGRDLAQGCVLAGRTSGDSTVAYALAFSRAAEAALDLDVPARAHWLRAVMAELERIANHLGDIGAVCNDAAFALMLAHCSILREQVLRTAERVFGHRLMRDRIVPGGTACDLSGEGIAGIRSLMATLRRRFPALVALYDKKNALQDRTIATGRLAPALAQRFGAGGFVGRASGRAFDTRRCLPYPPYDQVPFEPPVLVQGDVDARIRVRMAEVETSLSLLDQMLARMPAGPVRADGPAPGDTREGVALVEGFRGDVLVWLRLDETGRIERCHLRDPSWFQWPLLEAAIEGDIVADFPLCNKSFNCSYSGHDL